LRAIYPKQKPHFDAAHENAGLKRAGLAEGREFGLEVAKTLLKVRKDDPGAGDNGYAASMYACCHRLDPINPVQGCHAPFYGMNAMKPNGLMLLGFTLLNLQLAYTTASTSVGMQP